MIDIHTHILPHLDDGADGWDDALAMAALAVRSGVAAVIATPHSGLRGQPVQGRAEILRELLAELRRRLEREQLPLTVYEGMEIYGTEETAYRLERGELTTLNRSRYPLIEFPFERYERQATQILGEVLSLGYRPVVAHPERYQYVQFDPTILNVWVDMGCLLQINRGSILGRFGVAAEELAWTMVHRGFVCAVASDAHSSARRTTWMKDVYDLIGREVSLQAAQTLLEKNPGRLLRDKAIELAEPDWF